MSHAAFELRTVAEKCKHVQSLASWKNFLMVGCSDGTLHLYQTSNADSSTQFDLIKSIPKFSRQKKAIMQLEVVEKWSMLLCLCDSYVCLHDLASFNFIQKMRKTKYCNTFCTLEDEGMLCCAVNKQLLVFKWNGQQFLDYNELNLPSNPRVISFLGPARICVGFRREYDLLDVESGELVRELVRTGKSEKPVLTTVKMHTSWEGQSRTTGIEKEQKNYRNAKKIKKNRYADPGELLVAKDSWGIFFGQDGDASRNTSEFVQWTNCPDACVTAFPFLVSTTADAVEIHHIGTLRCAQLITISNANCIITAPCIYPQSPTGNSNGSYGNQGITKKNNISLPRVFFSTSTSVYMLNMMPIDDQLDELSKKSCFPEAISLCQLSRERLVHVDYNGSVDKYNTRLHSLRWQYIESLFKKSDYNRALLQCKEGISDPLLVISLFAGLAPDGVNQALEHNSGKAKNATNDGKQISSEAPAIATPHDSEFTSSFDNKAITTLLIPYLMFVRGWWKQQSKLKQNANNNHNDFFAIDRKLESSGRRITLKQLVDTSLLTAYIRTNYSTERIRQFYVDDSGLGCDCLVKEMEALLLDMPEKWEELVWLYYNNDFHQKALDWLGETETAKIQPPYPSVRIRIVKTIQYLHTLMGKMSQSILSSKNTQFAQHNNVHGMLVMEYFQWVFQQDPFFALKLFTSFTLPQQFQGIDASKATTESIGREVDRIVSFFSIIDPLTVLDHIKAQESSSGTGDAQPENGPESMKFNKEFINSVCITFLEFALLDLPKKFMESGSRSRSKYDETFGDDIALDDDESKTDDGGRGRKDVNRNEYLKGGSDRSPLKALEKEVLHEHLILLYLDEILRNREAKNDRMKHAGPILGPSVSAEKEPGASGDLRRRLLRFLQSSKFYRPEKILSKFQKTSMYEERAILLRSAGRHEEALQIYVHDLCNLDLAAQYCEEVYNESMKKTKASQRNEGKDVYMKLMRTCLLPVMRRSSSVDSKNRRGVKPNLESESDTSLIQRAMKLLRAHSSRIDIVEAIRLLPDTTEISALTPYFSSALKNIASQRRSNQIVKNMLKLEQLHAMKEQAILKSKHVVVDRDTRCHKCGHPFTARSVPAVFPDMSVYHVACSVESDEFAGY